jgi:outer membrane protein
MNRQFLLIITAIVLGLSALIIALVFSLSAPKTAYVDLGKVYNEFALKKELEGKIQQLQQIRKAQLDSIELDLNILGKNLQSPAVANREELENQFREKREQYMFNKQKIDEESANLTQTYDDQIWKQLNQYIKDYGKAHKYTYIFGAEGSGALMYADDAVNITESLSVYANNQYKGKAAK